MCRQHSLQEELAVLAGRRLINCPCLASMSWSSAAVWSAARGRLPKSAQQEVKPILFRPTFGTRRARAKWRRRAIELGNGHVDILINNAGIFPFGPTNKTTEEEFDRVYSLNVKAPYFLVAELAPLMAKRGKGAIVNVSTMVADYGVSGMSLYGSSKAAINLLTKSWAAEYGRSGVRVNAVSPGPTRTEGTDAMGEGLEQLAAQAPAGRPATADEIAEAIVFLATDRSSFIYGAKLAVDGGRTAI